MDLGEIMWDSFASG